MNKLVRKIVSIFVVFFVLLVAAASWILIEVGFDGCCGAPTNNSNNSLQHFTHLAAFAIAGLIIWLVLRWGWKRDK